MTNLTQKVEIPNKTIESRRSFLLRLGAIIATVPVLSGLQTDFNSFDQQMERFCPGLIKKFDCLSLDRKQRLIETLGSVQPKFETDTNTELTETVREVMSNMRHFFVQRMAR